MRRRIVETGLISLLFPAGLLTQSALAQTESPPPPLPEAVITAPQSVTALANGQSVVTIRNGKIHWGDVVLTADTIVYRNDFQHIEANGHVVLTRGDETLHGDSFVYEGRDGVLGFENAVFTSPPYFLQVKKATRNADGFSADTIYFTTSPDGHGEFFIRADRFHGESGSRYLYLERPSFHLFGKRILTLPRYRVQLTQPGEKSQNPLSLPVTVHGSRIGGLAVVADLPFVLGPALNAHALFDLPSRRAPQVALSLVKDWNFANGNQTESKPSESFLSPPDTDSTESPIRRFLRARPKPTLPDSLLDFSPLLRGTLLENPIRTTRPNIKLSGAVTANQEVTDRRRGFLLLSRLPEVQVSGFLPLGYRDAPSDDRIKPYLRHLRPALIASVTQSAFIERQLGEQRKKTRSSRTALSLDIAAQPLLIGNRFLMRGQAGVIQYLYQNHQQYRFLESVVEADYLLSRTTYVGASYFVRATQGHTPLGFDFIDTPSEARLRGQTAFGKNERYTIAVQSRIDAAKGRLFDYEVALGLRGKAIEITVTYGKLANRFGFGFQIPRLSF